MAQWTEQPKNNVNQEITYNESTLTYNDSETQYGGANTVVWTEQTRN